MKFVDSAINQEQRYSLGQEQETGRYYVSVPVNNMFAEYEEYFEIEEMMFRCYPENMALVNQFADECRSRLHDSKMLTEPESERGVG